MVLGLLVDVAELAVPVGVLPAFDGLGVPLEAEAFLAQHVGDGVGGYPVTLAGEFGGQMTGGLRRPPQRRHRITPHIRLDQGQQRRTKSRVQIDRPLAASTRPAHSPQRGLAGFQFIRTQRHRGLPHPGGPGDQPDPAMADRPGFRSYQQTPLPLIQMREDRLELGCQSCPLPLRCAHTTPTSRPAGSYGFMLCEP